ncbi:MAG TPA: folate-binding protein [Coxiellaceae bacterium]|nr:MAG: hypothetical protein A3E81_03420 [Gammaproteobacteria bacterium RIFCSPHIGHO2_12_FULL_36_30]HLB56350.1 folate-binding protein [Coxiellaceae bacterium]
MITQLNSFSALKFTGAKAQEFLQGQLTCDMQKISLHGEYSLAAVCDHKGRMVANFWVVKWHDDFLFILPKSMLDIVKNHLEKYAVFSKVSIALENKFFIFAFTLPRELLKEQLLNAITIQLPNKNRQLILAEKNNFSNTEINSDETIWKKNNIADELCILYPETSLLFTPQMIGLEKLGGVSFTKGCYVGQEIIARTEHLGTLKRHLHSLKIQSDQTLNPGNPLKNSKNEIMGVVVEAVKFTENTYEILAVIQDQMFYNSDGNPPQQH